MMLMLQIKESLHWFLGNIFQDTLIGVIIFDQTHILLYIFDL